MANQNQLNSWCLQIIKIGIFVILFLPLLANENFLFPFVFPRTIAFRLLVEICLIFYLTLIISAPQYRTRWSKMLVLLTAFIGIMFVASIAGTNFYHSFWSSIERSEGILTWLHLLAFFVILTGIFKNREDWRPVFKIVVIAAWLQSLYALGQVFNLSFALKTTGTRIGGSLGNPSFLAAYLIFIIFIAAYLSTQTRSIRLKLSYTALILIDVFLIFQTQTRGAILSLGCGLLLLLVFNIIKAKKLAVKIGASLACLLLLSSALFVYANKEQSWVKNQPALGRITSISFNDITTQNRLIVWSVGWLGFLERPWLGWGWENFHAPFNKYFNPAIARDVGSQPWYDRAHNVIVEVTVATGVFGLLAYLAIIGLAVLSFWSKLKDNQWPTKTALLFSTLLIVYFLQNIFVFDTLNSYIMFFLILGFSQAQPTLKLPPETLPSRWAAKNRAALILLIIVSLPIAYWFNVRPTLANYYVIKAVTQHKTEPAKMLANFQKAFSYSPPNDQELRFILVQYTRDQINWRGVGQETTPLINFTITEMTKSLQASPDSVQNYLLLGELYLATSQLNQKHWQLAEDVSLRALEFAPQRYQIYTLLGRLKMSQGKFDDGINYFKQATNLNHQFAEGYWNLAVAYILSRQPLLAQAALDQAEKLNFPVYSAKNAEKLLAAYQDSKDLEATVNFLEVLIKKLPEADNYRQLLDTLKQISQ